MENASKTLLIAAAILIVILLIAFGMNIFNQATNAGDADDTASTLKNGITQTQNTIEQMIPTWTITK